MSTKSEKNDIIHKIMGIEGGYSNHKSDSGGKTKYGITEALARKYGYLGDMRDLTKEKAFEIYDLEFYKPLNIEKIAQTSRLIAHEIMDTAVNCGAYRAGEFLQRSLNVLNAQGKYWLDLKIDGQIGRRTIEAFMLSFVKRKQTNLILMRMLNGLQAEHYISLAERRQKDEDFIGGWFLNRVDGGCEITV